MVLPAEPDQPQLRPDNGEVVPAGRRLRALLRDIGVGGRTRWSTGRQGWTSRYLDELSQQGPNGVADRVSYGTFSRLVSSCDDQGHAYLCDEQTFVRVLATLARAGVPATTLARCKQAYVADKRAKIPTYGFDAIETGASAADLMVSVIEGLTDSGERQDFVEHFARQLSPERRREVMRAFLDALE